MSSRSATTSTTSKCPRLSASRSGTSVRSSPVAATGADADTLNPMSSSDRSRQPATPTTEITLSTGEHYHVEGDAKDVERIILDAARGSIMQLAWLTEAETGQELAINPEHVVMLRTAGS